MNRPQDFIPSTRCISSENNTASGSSDYSTCSDNPGLVYSRTENTQRSQQSTILSGHFMPNQEAIDELDINDTNYSINLLEKNIDVLTEEDDIFEDSKEASNFESNKEDDSSVYIPLESASILPQMNSNNQFYKNYLNANDLSSNAEPSKLSDFIPIVTKEPQTESERLVTIVEETEVTYTTNSIIVKNKSPIQFNNTGDLIVNVVEKLKSYEKYKPDGNCSKRVFFANDDNIINDNQENNRTDKSTLKKSEKANSLTDKNQYFARREKDINENRNNHNHNTTESFVLWEKYFESSENKVTRRSLSFSELNSITESYGGDDEYSTSFKTLDDMYLSNCSSDTIHDKKNLKHKRFNRRSKSCDDLLKEVKHLPHIIYQRFLKCLSKEIDNMLKQNIVCTCHQSFKKPSNKENDKKDLNHATCIPAGLNKKTNSTKEKQLTSRVSPLKSIANKSRLTPERLIIKISPSKSFANESKLTPDRLLTNSSKNPLRVSPKSPNKTPTKKREFYCWRKEIVSPVGEYIRGKRQSPFQSSPNKKKV